MEYAIRQLEAAIHSAEQTSSYWNARGNERKRLEAEEKIDDLKKAVRILRQNRNR